MSRLHNLMEFQNGAGTENSKFHRLSTSIDINHERRRAFHNKNKQKHMFNTSDNRND